jgi:hypothetical protein
LNKFVLNPAGVREMLKSAELEGVCMSYAQSAAAKAGTNYTVESRHYPERSGAAVVPANAEGHFDNLRNNTLLKVIGG